MLEVIQDRAWALWNDFLEPEFGFLKTIYRSRFPGTEVFIFTTGIRACFTLIQKHDENLSHTSVGKASMFKAASHGTTTEMPKAGRKGYETVWMR